jgi:hypothetical protein
MSALWAADSSPPFAAKRRWGSPSRPVGPGGFFPFGLVRAEGPYLSGLKTAETPEAFFAPRNAGGILAPRLSPAASRRTLGRGTDNRSAAKRRRSLSGLKTAVKPRREAAETWSALWAVEYLRCYPFHG